MRLRTLLFWMHLVVGVVAGLVILVMCVTGVALTYEKQLVEWADARAFPLAAPSSGVRPLAPEALLARVAAAEPEAAVASLVRRADPSAPATVMLVGNQTRLVDPYTGAVLGPPPSGVRDVLRAMTSWHRWLALEGAARSTGRWITGLANLGFLFIVVSGLYLWLPRVWTRLQFAQVLWFRRGLPARARDFNWHNVIGIWSALPLAIVVAGAVPISFPWASDLVYRLAGEAPPAAQGRPGPAPGGDGGARGDRRLGAPSLAGLDAAWARAEAQVPGWRTISVRVPAAQPAPFVFSVDAGSGGQPQRRGTLTIDRGTATVAGWETFADLSPGRRARSWLRFAHTGEYYGLTGQTVAGLVSAGGAVLVYTGLALAWRRGRSWLQRRGRSERPRAA